MNINLIKLNVQNINQFIELIKMFEMVFEMKNFAMPDKTYLQKILEKEDFIAFAALDGNEVVGGLTAYTVEQYYSHQPLAFIYDIAIKNKYQRMGIGKKLIFSLAEYCKMKGVEQMFVLADSEDRHAVEFYRSTKATESNVINFDYYLK
ncbi:MAG TPA: GNAT family N-acetyltransferase [Bacteroidia bacterium]|jgi:ribosomal protein S18 acetylase RimI-like enzyme|nr:GNAT family N-acetyltransferase [Bacteroidia bacterium]